MMIDLRRYTMAVSREVLPHLLDDPSSLTSELAGASVDFAQVQAVLHQISSSHQTGPGLDALLAPALYRAMRSVPLRVLSDPDMWTWLTVTHLSGFVRQRWLSLQSSDPLPDPLSDADHKHFVLARPNLNAMSRHGAARLYWAAHVVTGDSEPDDDLIGRCFLRSDLYAGIFEREAGNSTVLVRALIGLLPEEPEPVRREVMRLVNLRLGTMRIECSHDEQAVGLVSGILDRVRATAAASS